MSIAIGIGKCCRHCFDNMDRVKNNLGKYLVTRPSMHITDHCNLNIVYWLCHSIGYNHKYRNHIHILLRLSYR